jgi:hypothetical protein
VRQPLGIALVLSFCFAASAVQAATVADLHWLAGCWASVDGEAGSGEQWTPPAGGTLLGVSRTVKKGRTVAYEFLQIREIEPGKLAYIAKPSGQAEATFPLKSAGEREVVFEDPEHDFPQRVIYRLGEDGALRASIEGLSKGQLRTIEFPMKKMDCESQR